MTQSPDTPDAPQAPAPQPPRKRSMWQDVKSDSRWAAPLTFFAIIGMAGLLYGSWQVPPQGTEDLANVTDTLFASGNHSAAAAMTPPSAGEAPRETTNLLAGFEILSVLLLAALIAGVVIALRERGDA